jgi:hypothetical protein
MMRRTQEKVRNTFTLTVGKSVGHGLPLGTHDKVDFMFPLYIQSCVAEWGYVLTNASLGGFVV